MNEMQAMHDYCELAWRVWEGGGGRAERVANELSFYDAHVLCLQEVCVCVCVCACVCMCVCVCVCVTYTPKIVFVGS